MICFDVYVNSEKVCRAGKEEMSVMNAILSFCRQSEHYEGDEIQLSVGGLFEHSNARVHPRWVEHLNLKPGDEVSIRIVESDSADEPSHEVAYTSEDDQRQERAYFERMRKKFDEEAD
jgi:hypothetical protein